MAYKPSWNRDADARTSPKQPNVKDVKVIVGALKRAYFIEKDILTIKSAFFRAALSGDWKEAKSNTVKLPETAEDVFTLFSKLLRRGAYGWLQEMKYRYRTAMWISVERSGHNSFSRNGGKVPHDQDRRAEFYLQETELYISTFIFGDQLQCPRVCNMIIDTLSSFEGLREQLGTSPQLIKTIVDTPTSTGALQNLMIDTFTSKQKQEGEAKPWTSKRWAQLDLPEDMIFLCAERMAGSQSGRESLNRTDGYGDLTCQRYHEHDEGEGRCTSRWAWDRRQGRRFSDDAFERAMRGMREVRLRRYGQ